MIKINKLVFGEIPTYKTEDEVGTPLIVDTTTNEHICLYFEEKISKILDNESLRAGDYRNTPYDVDKEFNTLADDIIYEMRRYSRDIETNANLFYAGVCDATNTDTNKRLIAMIKLDPKVFTTYKNNEFVNTNNLPAINTCPSEAFIIDADDKKIYVLEKQVKFLDGDKDYYISNSVLRNAVELGQSHKQMMNSLYKVINKVNESYSIYDVDTKAIVNNAIDNLQDINGTNIYNVVETVFKDEDIQEVAESILNNLGITKDDKLNFIDFKKLQKVKLNLDDEQIIEMSTEDYINKDNGVLEIREDCFGHKKIIINNINDVKVKI